MVVCRNTASGIFAEGQADDEISWDQTRSDEISGWNISGATTRYQCGIRWDSMRSDGIQPSLSQALAFAPELRRSRVSLTQAAVRKYREATLRKWVTLRKKGYVTLRKSQGYPVEEAGLAVELESIDCGFSDRSRRFYFQVSLG